MPVWNDNVINNATSLPMNHLEADSNSILIVGLNHTLKLYIKALEDTADTITLTINGKNLFNGEYDSGYLTYGKRYLHPSPLRRYRTTKWFPVVAKQGKSLVLSGTAHNRSTWQFKTADRKIVTKAGAPQNYKIASDVMQDKTVSKVNIPRNAAYARVFYASLKDESAALLDNRMQIEYGKLPTHYTPYQIKKITLPRLAKGDCITYEGGVWTLTSSNGVKHLEIETPEIHVGDMVTISSSACRIGISLEEDSNEVKRTGIYGVRWNTNDSNPVCERIGDAKNLHFNCVIGKEPLTPYQNDFDYIYPWSDIRICAVKIKKDGKRKITYNDSPDFKTDGSIGNIMVEIPKFYCKREVIDNYEYLWISPTKQEGFTLDPSFATSEGTIKRIYIGAYLARMKKKKLISVSNSFPLIQKSMRKLRELVVNSNGFTECDLLSILTVQRLFLVETALLDSQSLFPGNVYLPYLLKSKSTPYYALRSEKGTNRILVADVNMTRRFRVGDAVSVIDEWAQFKNKKKKFQRVITKIKPLGNKTLEIEFTGDPVDIVERKTGITCIPCMNGETDGLSYITGSMKGRSGHTSFKYRGIENLWGNIFIFLDHAYVRNSELYVQYPTGETVRIGYKLPVQKVQLSLQQFDKPVNIVVRRMGYDKEQPLIMLPSEVGNGATTSSYYSDAWYSLAKKNVTYALTYGGAWDNKGYAGIFNFRATFTEKESIPCNGARIMLR